MIANCGAIGVDWRTLSLSAYFETCEAHEIAHDGGQSAPPSEGLKRFFKAHAND